jgi:hypothetical protein
VPFHSRGRRGCRCGCRPRWHRRASYPTLSGNGGGGVVHLSVRTTTAARKRPPGQVVWVAFKSHLPLLLETIRQKLQHK